MQVPHVLAFMCEFHAQRGENVRVVSILQKMVQQGIDVEKFVDQSVLDKYGRDAGIEPEPQEPAGGDAGATVYDELKPAVDSDVSAAQGSGGAVRTEDDVEIEL